MADETNPAYRLGRLMETSAQVRDTLMGIAADLDARTVSRKQAQHYRQRLHDAAAALERGIAKAEGK